jgi:ABC-2 type transport system permease protein
MSRVVWTIAVWEFWRWFKLKDFLVSFAVSLVVGALAFVGMRYLLEDRGPEVRIAWSGPEELAPRFPEGSRIRVERARGRSAAELEAAVARKELDGVLTWRGAEGVELFAAKKPGWQAELVEVLQAEHSRRQIAASGLEPARLAAILAPLPVATRWGDQGASRIKLIVALLMTLFMLFGVFVGSAYLFTGITGEKQLRVTEQVVSAVRPQAWIDGKILGTTLFALVSMAAYTFASLAIGPLWNLVAGGWYRLPWSWDVVPLGGLLTYFLLAVLGMLLWFALLAAVCATINDPNTSGRSAALFIPVLCSLPGFLVFKDPDLPLLRVLGWIPFTSPGVLPARLAAGDVRGWEIGLAVGLLLAAIWLARLAAGRVFGMAILIHGKEPSWQEIWKAARRSAA